MGGACVYRVFPNRPSSHNQLNVKYVLERWAGAPQTVQKWPFSGFSPIRKNLFPVSLDPPTPICIYRNLEYPIHTAGVNFRGPKENPAEAGPKGRIVQKNQFAAISDAPSSIATRAKSACICSAITDLSCWFSIVI